MNTQEQVDKLTNKNKSHRKKIYSREDAITLFFLNFRSSSTFGQLTGA
jgi:hypothetical protein